MGQSLWRREGVRRLESQKRGERHARRSSWSTMSRKAASQAVLSTPQSDPRRTTTASASGRRRWIARSSPLRRSVPAAPCRSTRRTRNRRRTPAVDSARRGPHPVPAALSPPRHRLHRGFWSGLPSAFSGSTGSNPVCASRVLAVERSRMKARVVHAREGSETRFGAVLGAALIR
jgi:hypothetical protein